MGPIVASLSLLLLLPQGPVPAAAGSTVSAAAPAAARGDAFGPVPEALDSGLLVVDGDLDKLPWRALRLGDGGVVAGAGTSGTAGDVGECTTAGGVRVQCRAEGVKLTFASGRELLVAPDGFVHLRDGSHAGPFAGGLELRLLDDARVRIDLGSGRRSPIAEVIVTDATGAALRLWHRQQERFDRVERSAWAGERLHCLGDGGALYRVLALGPVVTLQRLLAPADARGLPEHRLALLVEPVVRSLQELLASRDRIADPGVLGELRLVLAERARALPTATPPARTRTAATGLQFVLSSGYDLALQIDGAELGMTIARHEQRPFAAWRLGLGAAVRCGEAPLQQKGNFITVPLPRSELRPASERLELPKALAVVRALMAGD